MHARFDIEGRPVAFFDAGIHTSIPEDAVEISRDQWSQLIEAPGQAFWDADTGQVIFRPVDELAQARASKLAELERTARTKIVAGFESDALGSPHRYDSEETDQLNLIGAVQLGITLQYRCTEVATGIKAHREHTASEIAQVLNDGAVIKMTLLQTLAAKRALVEAATTIEDVQAITW